MRNKKLAVGAIVCSTALLTSACMQGGTPESAAKSDFQNPTVGEVAKGALDGTTMTYVSWGGEMQNSQMSAWAKPFSKQSGAEILSDSPVNFAKLRAQVNAENVSWGLVGSAPAYGAAYCGELFEPINYDLIDLSKFPDGIPTSDCAVPSLAYGYGFFYNKEKYEDNPPENWKDFFNTSEFPGTRAIDGRPTPTAGTYEAALLADGVPKEDLYPLDVERALDKWSTIRNSLSYWSSGAEQTQIAQSGEADMIFGWSGRILEANQNGANFVPVWENSITSFDAFTIPKDTPNPLAAHAFINFALGAQQQEKFAELTGYSPVNSESDPNFDEETEKFNATAPEALEVSIPQNGEYWGKNIDELSKAWGDWLNS